MIVLAVLAGFLGIVSDTAHLQAVRQQAQTAADAAAVGALREMPAGGVEMLAAARADAARNGMPESDGVRVEVANPPRVGDFAGDTAAVEATVTRVAPTLFMGIFGQERVTVAGRSVAIRGQDGRVTLGE